MFWVMKWIYILGVFFLGKSLLGQYHGTYSIGSDGDFAHFNEMVDSLQTYGMSGDVEVFLASGSYAGWDGLVNISDPYQLTINGGHQDSVILHGLSDGEGGTLSGNIIWGELPNLSLKNMTIITEVSEAINLYNVSKLHLENIDIIYEDGAIYLETDDETPIEHIDMINVHCYYNGTEDGMMAGVAIFSSSSIGSVTLDQFTSAPLTMNWEELTSTGGVDEYGVIVYSEYHKIDQIIIKDSKILNKTGMVLAGGGNIGHIALLNDSIYGSAAVQINNVDGSPLNDSGDFGGFILDQSLIYGNQGIQFFSAGATDSLKLKNSSIHNLSVASVFSSLGDLKVLALEDNVIISEASKALELNVEGKTDAVSFKNNKWDGTVYEYAVDLNLKDSLGFLSMVKDSFQLESGALLSLAVDTGSAAQIVFDEINFKSGFVSNVDALFSLKVAENVGNLEMNRSNVDLQGGIGNLLMLQTTNGGLNKMKFNDNDVEVPDSVIIVESQGVMEALSLSGNHLRAEGAAFSMKTDAKVENVVVNSNQWNVGAGVSISSLNENIRNVQVKDNVINAEDNVLSLTMYMGEGENINVANNKMVSNVGTNVIIRNQNSALINVNVKNNDFEGVAGINLKASNVSDNVVLNGNVIKADSYALKSENVSDLELKFNQVKSKQDNVNVGFDIQQSVNNVGQLNVVANEVDNVIREAILINGYENVNVRYNQLSQSVNNVGTYGVSIENVGKKVLLEGNEIDLDTNSTAINLRNVGDNVNVGDQLNVNMLNNFIQGGVSAIDGENVGDINVFNNSIYVYHPTDIIRLRSSDNVNVRNNLVKADNVGTYNVINVGDNVGNNVDDNVYDILNGAQFNVDDNVYNDFVAYQDNVGMDNVSQLSDIPFESDWSNLRLDCESSLFNGADLNVTYDIDGFARGSQPTIGAHELNPVAVDVIKDEEMYMCAGPVNVGLEGNVESFVWSTGDTTRMIAVDTPGWYVVNVTTACNQSFSDSILVRAAEPSNVGFNVIVSDLNVDFINVSDNVGDVMWYFGDGDSSNVLNPSHTYLDSAEYVVTLVVSTPCITLDTSIVINTGINTEQEEETSIEEQVVSHFHTVYPNPSNGIIRLMASEEVALSVIDLTGKTVWMKEDLTNGTQLDLRSLKAGLYILQIKGSEESRMIKWKKE